MLSKIKNSIFSKFLLGFAIFALFLTTFGVYSTMVGDTNREIAVHIDGEGLPLYVLRDFANRRAAGLPKGLLDSDNPEVNKYLSALAIQDAMDYVFWQDLARGYKVEVDDELIYRGIANKSAFLDEEGKFSPTTFKGFLNKLGIQTSDFMSLEENIVSNEFIKLSLENTIPAQNSISRAITEEVLNQKRDARVIVFSKRELQKSVSVSESELIMAYDQDSVSYMTKAGVVFEYFVINDDEFQVNKRHPSNAELEVLFNEKYANKENLDEVELEYLKLDSDKYSKEELKQKIDELSNALKHSSFAKVSSSYPDLSKKTGMVFVSSYPESLQEQIKDLKKGESSSKAIFTEDGIYFIKIIDKITYSGASFISAKEELTRDWFNRERSKEISAINKSLLDIGVEKTLSAYSKKPTITDRLDIGSQLSDELRHIPITDLYSQGFLESQSYKDWQTPGGLLFVKVKEVLPPTKLPFKDVKWRVKLDMVESKAQSFFTNALNVSGNANDKDLLKRLETQLGIKPISIKSYEGLTRASANGLPSELSNFIFEMVGTKTSVVQPFISEKGYYVVELTGISSEGVGPFKEPNITNKQVKGAIDYYLNKRRVEAKVEFADFLQQNQN